MNTPVAMSQAIQFRTPDTSPVQRFNRDLNLSQLIFSPARSVITEMRQPSYKWNFKRKTQYLKSIDEQYEKVIKKEVKFRNASLS